MCIHSFNVHPAPRGQGWIAGERPRGGRELNATRQPANPTTNTRAGCHTGCQREGRGDEVHLVVSVNPDAERSPLPLNGSEGERINQSVIRTVALLPPSSVFAMADQISIWMRRVCLAPPFGAGKGLQPFTGQPKAWGRVQTDSGKQQFTHSSQPSLQRGRISTLS